MCCAGLAIRGSVSSGLGRIGSSVGGGGGGWPGGVLHEKGMTKGPGPFLKKNNSNTYQSSSNSPPRPYLYFMQSNSPISLKKKKRNQWIKRDEWRDNCTVAVPVSLHKFFQLLQATSVLLSPELCWNHQDTTKVCFKYKLFAKTILICLLLEH